MLLLQLVVLIDWVLMKDELHVVSPGSIFLGCTSAHREVCVSDKANTCYTAAPTDGDTLTLEPNFDPNCCTLLS